MADDEAQGQEGSSWSASDATCFGEPLVWPETGAWEEPRPESSEGPPLVGAEHPTDLEARRLFPPTPEESVIDHGPHSDFDVLWQATGHDGDTTVHHDQALGGAEAAVTVGSSPAVEPLSESIWSAPATNGDIGLISASASPTPPVYPAAERSTESRPWRRFDFRQGNAAVVGLISVVSLVLLGMFLSVRARNDLPTDSSQSRRPSNEISVTGSLNTVPLTTTVTTTAPTAAINIADLLPAVEADVEPARDATAAGSGSGSPATAAAPARRTGPRGGGGATTPAAAPAPKPPAPKSPPPTSAPVALEDTETPSDTSPTVDTTRPKRPTSTFRFPSFPTTTDPDDDGPSYTFPSWSNIDD